LRLAVIAQQRGNIQPIGISQTELAEPIGTQDQTNHFQQRALATTAGAGDCRHLATAKNQARQDDLEYLDPRVKCLPSALPRAHLPVGYNTYQIEQIPGYVVMLYEWNHLYRYIPLDGRPHVNADIRLGMGDSRGHWEGDTLVVDTTNFLRETSFRGGVTTSDLHLRERFTRVSDGTLMYEVTTEDPNTWNRPWTYRIPMVKSEYPLYEYACHEGNYALPGILGGARAEERAAEGR